MNTQAVHYELVPPHLVIKAMRDSGYKNAAYALAELIDNAVQAGARTVQLLCLETEKMVNGQKRRQVEEIAVLDDGCGMDANVLRMALQFGNGTRLEDRSGIGRFGMGLPNSSISQCQRVDVWSWQHGTDQALHTYLDIALIEKRQQVEVPEPKVTQLPSKWCQMGGHFDRTGTLVVWSRLDRCAWKTARAVIENSELLIGRIYRRFLAEGRVRIRMARFSSPDFQAAVEDRDAQINDPMYTLVPSSCPEPYSEKPMFMPHGEKPELTFHVDLPDGSRHPVVVRFAYAREEARTGLNPGSLPHGRHAARNIGVSIVRADRELELCRAFEIGYEPTERWWGVEVEFPPALDDIFGVANNKQSARFFTDAAGIDIERLLKEETKKKTVHELADEWKAAGDPLAHHIPVIHHIKSNLSVIRSTLRDQTKNSRSRRTRHDAPNSAEAIGTAAVRKRKEAGHAGVSDQGEALPESERIQAVEEALLEQGLSREAAHDYAVSTISSDLKYRFVSSHLDSPSFFSVRPQGGILLITLNTSHPAYKHLIELLEDQDGSEQSTNEQDGLDLLDLSEDALRKRAAELNDRLVNTWRGLKLLLAAWARYEDEQPDGALRMSAQDSRTDWGRVARDFLLNE